MPDRIDNADLYEEKLEELLEIEGEDDLESFLERYVFESCVPGICINDECDYSTEYEPDQSEGWCEHCDTGTVVSGLVLAGIM